VSCLGLDAGSPVLDLECPCGHQRRDHADTYSRCDACECQKYSGDLRPYWNTNSRPTLYGAYGQTFPTPVEDDSEYDLLMGDML